MAFGLEDKLGSVFIGNKVFNNQMFSESFNFYTNYMTTVPRTNVNGALPDMNLNSVAYQRGVE